MSAMPEVKAFNDLLHDVLRAAYATRYQIDVRIADLERQLAEAELNAKHTGRGWPFPEESA